MKVSYNNTIQANFQSTFWACLENLVWIGHNRMSYKCWSAKKKNSTLWSELKVKIFSNPYQSEENNKEKEKGKSSFLKGTLENILIAPKKGCTQYTQCIQYALKGKLK